MSRGMWLGVAMVLVPLIVTIGSMAYIDTFCIRSYLAGGVSTGAYVTLLAWMGRER